MHDHQLPAPISSLTIAEADNHIKNIELWLRNNPHAKWEYRYDMIARLKQLNEHLDQINNYENGRINR